MSFTWFPVAVLLTTFVNFGISSQKVVHCYYGSWATYRPSLGKFDVEDIDTSLCTHLVYAFAGINSQGTIISLDPYLDLPENWGRNNFAKFNALKVGKPNLKTILGVGGWNEGSAKYSRMAASPLLRKNFTISAVKIILDHGFDGLNLDWEYPNRRDSVNGAADIENFVLLLGELRQEFDKHGLLLSAAVAAVKDMASLSYDIPGISKYLDLVNIMTYDLYGPWDPTTGHNAPLHKGESQAQFPKEQLYTVDVAIDYWIGSGCPPEKLLIGLPAYGHTFTLSSAGANGVGDPSNGPGLAGPYTATNGNIGYNEFCYKLKTEAWDLRYDKLAMVPYAVQGKNWVSYDDADSLRAKVEYALKQNIAGVMVWSIETDDFRGVCSDEKYPLLKSINTALGNIPNNATQTTINSTATTPSMTPTTPKPTTTVPNTGGTTAPSSICKSEGLQPDPADVTSFYICVSDINGNLIPYKFKCPNNLHWDNANLICNYPDQIKVL
ncbi:unnamed protein product, partial [Iphiclides podalirius]